MKRRQIFSILMTSAIASTLIAASPVMGYAEEDEIVEQSLEDGLSSGEVSGISTEADTSLEIGNDADPTTADGRKTAEGQKPDEQTVQGNVIEEASTVEPDRQAVPSDGRCSLGQAESIDGIMTDEAEEKEKEGAIFIWDIDSWTETAGYYKYTKDEDSVTIYRYTGEEESVTIPEKIDGLPVTYIAGCYTGPRFEYDWIGAFEGCKSLKKVKIPEGVTDIAGGAFNCPALEEIYFFGNAPSLGGEGGGDPSLGGEGGGGDFSGDFIGRDAPTLYVRRTKTGWTVPEWEGFHTEYFDTEEDKRAIDNHPEQPVVQPQPVHTHSFTAWTTSSPATVFTPEVQTRTCTCGQKETRAVGSKLAPTLSLNAGSIVLKTKQRTDKLKVSGLAAGDSVKSWKSSNSKIVKVNGKGVVTAGTKTGKAKLTVTLTSGLQKTIAVKVQKKEVAAGKITGLPKKLTLKKGMKVQLKPAVQPITCVAKVRYKSSNGKAVKVSGKGYVTAKKKGKSTITVQYGKKKVKIKVTVK